MEGREWVVLTSAIEVAASDHTKVTKILATISRNHAGHIPIEATRVLFHRLLNVPWSMLQNNHAEVTP